MNITIDELKNLINGLEDGKEIVIEFGSEESAEQKGVIDG